MNNLATLSTLDLDTITNEDLVSPTIEQIWDMQTQLSNIPQHNFETKHYFAGGMYAREMFIPKGFALVGLVHKTQHFFQIVSGKIIVWSEGQSTIMTGPCLVVSEPGVKRVGFALEDTVCVNFHKTDKLDVQEIHTELTEPDNTTLLDAYNNIKKEQLQ